MTLVLRSGHYACGECGHLLERVVSSGSGSQANQQGQLIHKKTGCRSDLYVVWEPVFSVCLHDIKHEKHEGRTSL